MEKEAGVGPLKKSRAVLVCPASFRNFRILTAFRWEIFSLALQPYYGMSHEEVVKYLKEGKFLACPENTPKSAYRIMTLCWNAKVQDRPPFKILYRELEIIERELILIQRHFRSQKSILSESGGRITPQSPKSYA